MSYKLFARNEIFHKKSYLEKTVTFCLRMAYMTYFTVENIRFDQNLGNPTAENMDGVHIDGGCRFGSVRNVQEACYDGVVATNVDYCGDNLIENRGVIKKIIDI